MAKLSEARAEQAKRAADARARGAAVIDTYLVDGVFSVAFGLLVGGWYFGWFSGEPSELDVLLQRLSGREISVVVFELDNVMCTRDSRDGVPSHELEDYTKGVSQDFAEAAAALARRGFHLAVVTGGPPPEVTSSVPRSRQRRGVQAPPDRIWGPALAKALVARCAPDAVPAFGIMLPGSAGTGDMFVDRDQQMRDIAAFYRVPVRGLALFTASEHVVRGDSDSWAGVLVRNPKEGFRLDDSSGLPQPLSTWQSILAGSSLLRDYFPELRAQILQIPTGK